ncbi:Tetratricopeptide repeat protein 1 [Colletotrichum higginsianum IMI 349063]|uniref:Tetratricopeptide repeat protein 1 n=3 Tax=Colletotrichum higginsianum TaxID=80884 RepID=A0A1B7YL06_COLHI|nr:Tetratricopeptide repeat protein 1 [Colletotrichum higginsianum IMI 349063]OBR12733.1 Tetratricopeptide repeat protein 1 [Colletotrichum higginsianum IMI 349063]TIC98964.1 Tetratricopeptide repeat protein 1 [Colletotrichum higginsianum]GJC94407.1 tetratricopeptide repeat protein 1 [Colletotrichum higginsianum]
MAPTEAEKEPQEKGKNKSVKEDEVDEAAAQERFSPEEEASLLAESNANKTEANALFSSSKYEQAITKYDDAVATCPNYLDYELAVLRSNISACHLKLEQWKDAVSSASAALDALDRVDKEAALEQDRRDREKAADEDVEDEIVSSGAAAAAPAPPPEDDPEETARRARGEDVLRIRAKALMRRARARSEQGGWQNLAGAEEDYKTLSLMKNLAPADRRIVQAQLRALPPRTKAAQEAETAEMWGKLKDLGNGILKPFGLSTDNFQMVKDEKTGGYSMNFNQGQ